MESKMPTANEINVKAFIDKYVPFYGNAETVGGELLRALIHLTDAFETEGERLGCSDYAEAQVNPAGRYLYRMIEDEHIRELLNKCWGKDAFSKLIKYEMRLTNLSRSATAWICSQPELFNQPNALCFEDELECPLDKKNILGYDFTRDYGASLIGNGKKRRHS
jgi:hypothetical protein